MIGMELKLNDVTILVKTFQFLVAWFKGPCMTQLSWLSVIIWSSCVSCPAHICHAISYFFAFFHLDPLMGIILSITRLTPVVFNSDVLSSRELQLPPTFSSLPGYLSLFWAPIILSSSLIVHLSHCIKWSTFTTKLWATWGQSLFYLFVFSSLLAHSNSWITIEWMNQ